MKRPSEFFRDFVSSGNWHSAVGSTEHGVKYAAETLVYIAIPLAGSGRSYYEVNPSARLESIKTLGEYSGRLKGEKEVEKAEGKRRRIQELDKCLSVLEKAEADGLMHVERIRKDKSDWYKRDRLEGELLEGNRVRRLGGESFSFIRTGALRMRSGKDGKRIAEREGGLSWCKKL